jgi:hypothetical protein
MKMNLTAKHKFHILIAACALVLFVLAGPAARSAFADPLDDPSMFSNGASGTPDWEASESLTLDPWTGYKTVEYVFSSTYIGTGANLTQGIADFDSPSNVVEATVDFEDIGGQAVAFVYTATSTDGGNGSGLPTSFSGAVGTPVEETIVTPPTCTGVALSDCGYTASSSTVIGYDTKETSNPGNFNYTGMYVDFTGMQAGQTTLAAQAPEPTTLSSLAIGFVALGLCCWVQRKRKVRVLALAA